MKIGDLVRRKKVPLALRQDPRVGIVQSTFPSHPEGKLVCVVQWHDKTTGNYFNTCLEALCK
jgi:predicted O-linked N-acetylglucosamine transferase (SPINDLY family)